MVAEATPYRGAGPGGSDEAPWVADCKAQCRKRASYSANKVGNTRIEKRVLLPQSK